MNGGTMQPEVGCPKHLMYRLLYNECINVNVKLVIGITAAVPHGLAGK